jgi:ferredoxin like protein
MDDQTLRGGGSERLGHVRYVVDHQAHIQLDSSLCRDCARKPCTFCCPAELYQSSLGGVNFSYEGCLECGTCSVICELGSVQWSYPRGGFGVAWRFG